MSPIALTCASILIPNLDSIGSIIAAAATIGAVSLALEVPPPLRSASPFVLFSMTISWWPGRGWSGMNE